MRKGDIFWVNVDAIHFNPKQWQKPREFLPDRFDHSNPLSLTPDGKKRSAFAWVPFAGGKRICFGKTFAESTIKITATYFCQAFNFKMEEKKFETEFPLATFGMNGRNKVNVILTKNE